MGRLSRGLAEDRRNGNLHGLRPDGKTQVTVLYENTTPKAVTDILVSTQHSPDIDREAMLSYVKETLVDDAEKRKQLAERFKYSQEVTKSQEDPWTERSTNGVDAHEFAPLKVIG